MQVGVLGPLLVRVDDRDVTPRGQRPGNVFVVLLQRRGRPVPAEVVLDLVWGEAAAGLDASAVHTVVARLRRQLGPGAITSRAGGYLIDRGVSTDEDEFTELVAAARRKLDAGDPRGAADDYRSGLATWRGLEAFEGARPDLVEADRARLAELRAAAAEELAAAVLDHPGLGSATEALELASVVITSNPLRERSHQLAMLAAYRCQRQALALGIYQDLRRQLRAELGIEPTRASAQLHMMILRHEPSLDVQVPARPASIPGRTRILPAPVSPLVGRATEFAGLLTALANGHRLITLAGPGGVGKSRLLTEVGIRYTGPRRLVYIALSGLSSSTPDELAETVRIAHGVPSGQLNPLDSLIRALADGSWLLLIDEAEWVVDSLAIVVTAILAGCPGVQILLTSRIPLQVPGEMLVAIEPLRYPDSEAETPAIMAAPAVEFLVQRLADRAVQVSPDRSTAVLLASIAGRVDGLPLALELAAGQASGRSLADLALLVESPLDVPASGLSGNVRHRSLRDTLEWSMGRLPADHRTVLRRLSVYAGNFDLPDAAAVVGPIDNVGEIVRSLAREALIHVERTSASRLHFRLLRTVRDLAAEGLDPDELAVTQALHRRWHAGRWRVGGVGLVEGVRANVDDYLEALRTALESRDATTMADLTLTLTKFWQFIGGQAVGLRWIGRVLDSEVLSSDERARVLAQRAALALHHDPALVLADTAAAIPLLESAGSTTHTVTALSVRGLELLAQGRLSEATAHADHAVEIARGRTAEELANALGTQAEIYAVIENPDRAIAAIDEAVACLRSGPTTPEGVVATSSIALALVNLERFDDAVGLLDGIVIPPTAGPPPARFQLTLGWACLGAGDFSRALGYFLTAIPTPVYRRPADRHAAETVLGAACTLAALGERSAATALAGALELLGRVGYRSPPALERVVDRARSQVANQTWPQPVAEPTPILLERIERQLLGLASADSRSAAG